MSIFSFLKAPATIDKIANAVISGGDALILTDEERIQYNLKASEIHLKLTEKIGNESTPTAISRRIVGMMVLGPFAFLSIAGALIYPLSVEVSKHWLLVADNFQMPSLAVVTFYFSSHAIKALKG